TLTHTHTLSHTQTHTHTHTHTHTETHRDTHTHTQTHTHTHTHTHIHTRTHRHTHAYTLPQPSSPSSFHSPWQPSLPWPSLFLFLSHPLLSISTSIGMRPRPRCLANAHRAVASIP